MKITKAELIHGSVNIEKNINEFIENTSVELSIVIDSHILSIITNTTKYRSALIDVLQRGMKIKCISEVTNENLKEFKRLFTMVSEFRHLSGIKGCFATNHSEYIYRPHLSPVIIHQLNSSSSLNPVVEQGQYIFNTLWNNAAPAIKKIREIQGGIDEELIESINDPVVL